MKRVLVAAVAAMAMMVSQSPAYAGSETLHFSLKGLSANAFFSSTDPSSGIETHVLVSPVDGLVKEGPGGPEVNSTVYMQLFQFDRYGGQLLGADALSVLGPDDFQIDEKLTMAALHARIELTDFGTGTSFPLDVNIAWTGSGDTTTEKTHFHFEEPGVKVNSSLSRTFRQASAAGTVSDGTTNFTPKPALGADISSIKIGQVTITHE